MNQENQNQELKKLEEAMRDSAQDGPQYWRSFEELCRKPEFIEKMKTEFHQEPAWWDRNTTRRSFLQLMGGMMAMAGLAGCTRQPDEKIVPYVKAPEEMVPGRPLFFATAITLNGFARGVLVESHMGRPTKIEGNPNHPDSLGAADAITQASVLSLYDPDRSKTITKGGLPSTWGIFSKELSARLQRQKALKGKSLRLVTGTVISPSLAAQIQSFLGQYPEAKWIQYEPINRDNAHKASEGLFGKHYSTRFDVSKADVIFSADSDFMNSGPGSVRYAREFADRRRARKGQVLSGKMNRLYAVESMPSITGTSADHRLAIRSSEIEWFLRDLAHLIGLEIPASGINRPKEQKVWIRALADDLMANKGKSLVVVGDRQSVASIMIGHMINAKLGNIGKTVEYSKTIEAKPSDQYKELKNLSGDLLSGTVDDLIILGNNLAYDAPSDTQIQKAIRNAKFTVCLSSSADETAKSCQWHIPESHYLESWSDTRSHDGTATIVQPLIHPLYESKTGQELMAGMLGNWNATSHHVVRSYWGNALSDSKWDKALHDGIVEGSRFKAESPQFVASIKLPGAPSFAEDNIEIGFDNDPNIINGQFANNGWLQELPKPITRITWDNAFFMSPLTAKKMKVRNESVVEIQVGKNTVKGPVWTVPGHADFAVTAYLGGGRENAGKVGTGVGFDVNKIRRSDQPFFTSVNSFKEVGGTHRVACVQDHHSMEGRHLVREASVDEFKKHPDFAAHMSHDPKPNMTLYDPSEHLKGDHQWGMSIDLNVCNGCNACTVACQSENSIPIVGKNEVLNGREMHWIRVDRYYEGSETEPKVVHQPVPCMHCENAPCEPVCPVGATTHSDTGLNDMVYNRCVGTRYCSNNCTYKVRRFNFYQYADTKTPSLKLGRNPDVTVRTRGVMEKCTYCVQRINAAHIEARKDNRKVRDGEIVTACQQTCPTQAIQFGDIKDDNSKVAIDKKDGLNYGILTELGTRPRTSYLAKLRNPNPVIESLTKHETAHAGHH